MHNAKIRATLIGVRPHLPLLVAVACLVVAALAAVRWAVASGLGPGSFVLGVAAGALALHLMPRAAGKPEGGGAEYCEWARRRARLECQRMEADVEYYRWATRRTRLECRRLRQELRETDWRYGRGRES